ncbi:MAG: T9SS type A sorting domain-containing protein, partial [Saprospiraceae bacterium]|nr:T9SS type A sorting domain-containing protein [Saprospiraceae bacterium]
WTLSCPNYFINRTCNDTIIEVGKTLPDLDLELIFGSKKRNSNTINITAQIIFNTAVKSFSDENILEISPNRLWSVKGDLNLDPSIQTDVILSLDSSIDTLQNIKGTVGVVNRMSPSMPWQVFPTSTFDQDSNSIYISNFPIGYEWAVAKLSDQMTSTFNRHLPDIDVTISPNPASDDIKILLKVDRAMPIQIDLVDMHGRNIQSIVSENLVEGNYRYRVDVRSITSGAYIIQVVNPEGLYSRKIIRAGL